MCGIVGFTGKSNAVPVLLEGLERLEYRGYDSAGIATLHNGKISAFKAEGRIKALRECLKEADTQGFTGIGHTRWATHGEPSVENAHPHLSSDGRFAVVHNGIIENYAELKQELISEGFEFVSQTDTEVIPQLMQKYYVGDLKQAVESAVGRLKGSYALGILCSDYPDTLVAVKHFSPLILGIAENSNIIASDATAIISQTSRAVYIEDGDIAFLTPDEYTVFGSDGNEAERRVTEIDWDISSAEKGGYSHFMMKEIHEQPYAVAQTLESYVHNGKIRFDGFGIDAKTLEAFNEIEIVACGSAYHAGVVGKQILEELLGIPVNTELASEFRYRNPIISEKTLTIVISQSGETADTLAALREAKKRNSHTLAIVNVVGSSVARLADDVIYTRAGPEIAVATTKGYLTQLTVIYLFAIWASRLLCRKAAAFTDELLSELLLLPEKISCVLETEESIKKRAESVKDSKSVFFIGRGIDYAVALEASLKLKEVSYIHSEAYAAGELKHGTISLIEPGRQVIALCGCKRLAEKLIGNIKEVAARGARVTVCCTEDNKSVIAEADAAVIIPDTHPLLSPMLEVIPFQLLAYYTALFNGCDIDKPRNLAKSVTVE